MHAGAQEQMTAEIIRYPGKELTAFQLKRIVRAMSQKSPIPITAYLSDVVIANDCAIGAVFGQSASGVIEKRTDAYSLTTAPIFTLMKIEQFWVVTTKGGNFVLTSFRRGMGRASLRALIATADKPDAITAV